MPQGILGGAVVEEEVTGLWRSWNLFGKWRGFRTEWIECWLERRAELYRREGLVLLVRSVKIAFLVLTDSHHFLQQGINLSWQFYWRPGLFSVAVSRVLRRLSSCLDAVWSTFPICGWLSASTFSQDFDQLSLTAPYRKKHLWSRLATALIYKHKQKDLKKVW